MKKMVIWNDDRCCDEDERGGILIEPAEIETRIDLYQDTVYLFPELEVTEENKAMLKKFIGQFMDADERCDIEHAVGPEISVEDAGESEIVRDVLAFSREARDIVSLADYEGQKFYSFWDGNNQRDLWFDDCCMTETEVVYDENQKECLDTWDGSNWYFRSKHNHGELYPLLEVDGKPVENQFLFVQWTDYQGDLPSAQIINAEEAQGLRVEAGIIEERENYLGYDMFQAWDVFVGAQSQAEFMRVSPGQTVREAVNEYRNNEVFEDLTESEKDYIVSLLEDYICEGLGLEPDALPTDTEMKINWKTVKEFGDHDTVGCLDDGRWFWTWNLGEARDVEELLELGCESGEDGGTVYGSLDELLADLDSCRPDLAASVRKHAS